MVQVTLIVEEIGGGSKAVKRRLRKLSRQLKNMAPANKQVSIWLLRWVNKNFKSQGGKVGKWKPFKHGGRKLSDGSVDTSAKLLQDTGRLRRSFLPFHTAKTAGVGTGLFYGPTHEFGIPHRNIPIRRMLPLATDQDVIQGVVKIYSTYIQRAIR